MNIPPPNFEDEVQMRALLATLGFSEDKIELAITARRNRPHPSQRRPHPLKGKKRPRASAPQANENPAPGGRAGLDEPGNGTGGRGCRACSCDYNLRRKEPFRILVVFKSNAADRKSRLALETDEPLETTGLGDKSD